MRSGGAPMPYHTSATWPRRLRLFAACVAAFVSVAVAAALGLRALGAEAEALFRDVSAQYGIPSYAGAFTLFGVIVLSMTAAVLVFAIRLGARPRGLLAAVAALSVLLAADDQFLLHERYLPRDLGVPELAVLGAYALAMMALLAVHGRTRRGPELWVFLLPYALFAASVGADVFASDAWRSPLVEDIPKVAGFFAWMLYWTAFAADSLRAPGGIE